MSTLARVVEVLEHAGVPYAVCGAFALAAHGASRATVDLDLAVARPEVVLEPALWTPFAPSEVELRAAGPEDPLAGVVRVTAGGEAPVDVVVFGPNGWQRHAIERAVAVRVGQGTLHVLRAEDLILFKLYAGGPQDGWDVQSLLAGHPEAVELIRRVEAALPGLPARARRVWARVREGV